MTKVKTQAGGASLFVSPAPARLCFGPYPISSAIGSPSLRMGSGRCAWSKKACL
jgi:hypothetical protein